MTQTSLTEFPSQLSIQHGNCVDADSSNYKGYCWEMRCREEFLSIPSLLYEGNPTDWAEWKSLQGNNPLGYDAVITLPNGDKITLELKYRQEGGKVYHCWFVEDWLPRAADIYVTNNVDAIGCEDRNSLEREGKKLMSLSEAEAHIKELVWKQTHSEEEMERRNIEFKENYLRELGWKTMGKLDCKVITIEGNQLSNWNSYIQSIIGTIKSKITICLSKLANSALKIRDKLRKHILKKPIMPRLSVPKSADILFSVNCNTALSNTDLPNIVEFLDVKDGKLGYQDEKCQWLDFSVRQVNGDRLKLVWELIAPNTPMPNIQCFLLEQSDFIKIMQINRSLGYSEGHIWEYNRIIAPTQTAGCCLRQNKDQFAILLRDDIDYLLQILIHELSHIFNNDFSKFSKEGLSND